MNALNKAFGDTIRQRRERIGISQEELSFKAGVHRTYISQLERGLKGPTLRIVFSLAGALDVSPVELVRIVQERLTSKKSGTTGQF